MDRVRTSADSTRIRAPDYPGLHSLELPNLRRSRMGRRGIFRGGRSWGVTSQFAVSRPIHCFVHSPRCCQDFIRWSRSNLMTRSECHIFVCCASGLWICLLSYCEKVCGQCPHVCEFLWTGRFGSFVRTSSICIPFSVKPLCERCSG